MSCGNSLLEAPTYDIVNAGSLAGVGLLRTNYAPYDEVATTAVSSSDIGNALLPIVIIIVFCLSHRKSLAYF